jgi:hypothetical protein
MKIGEIRKRASVRPAEATPGSPSDRLYDALPAHWERIVGGVHPDEARRGDVFRRADGQLAVVISGFDTPSSMGYAIIPPGEDLEDA